MKAGAADQLRRRHPRALQEEADAAGVTVKLLDLGGVSGTTDEDGHFAFVDVPLGTHKVELSHPKFITVVTDETIAKGKRRTVKYLVEERDDEEGGDQHHRARAAHQEGGGRDPHQAPRRRGASPARRATR